MALGVRNHCLDDVLQLGEVEGAVTQLHLHGHTGGVAYALDRRRRQHHHPRVLDHVKRLGERAEHRQQALCAAALVPIVQHDVGDAGAGERCRAVEHGDAGNGDDLLHPGGLARDLLDPFESLLRALQRGAVGQLHGGDQVALILDRQEGGRNAGEQIPDDTDEDEHRHHPGTAARDDTLDQRDVAALGPLVDTVEGAIDDVALFDRHCWTQPQGTLRGLERRGIDRAEQRGRGDDQRELRVHTAGQTRQERGRDEHRHQHQRDADDRPEQLFHRADRGVVSGHALFDIVGGALDHDDGVVDDNADREHKREQRRHIDGEAHRRHGGERADDGDRHRGRGHQGRAPILQEEQDDDQHQDAGFEQRLVDLVDRRADEFRGVERDAVGQVLRKFARQLAHPFLDLVADVERIGARRLKDRKAGRWPAVEREHLAVGLRTELDATDVADAGDRTVAAGLDDHVGELLSVVEAAVDVERVLERLPGRRGRRASARRAAPAPPSSCRQSASRP